MDKARLEIAVVTATRVLLVQWKVHGGTLGAEILGIPTLGRVVLWTQFGLGHEVLPTSKRLVQMTRYLIGRQKTDNVGIKQACDH